MISVGCDCDAVLPCCPPKHTKSHLPLQFLHIHTHCHTCLRNPAHTHTQDIHRHTPLPPLSLLVAPISGFSLSIILLVWTGFIRSVCACSSVFICAHALYSYAYAGVWATLVVIVWYLVCICVGRCDFCACELWGGHQWLLTALTQGSGDQSCRPCKSHYYRAPPCIKPVSWHLYYQRLFGSTVKMHHFCFCFFEKYLWLYYPFW